MWMALLLLSYSGMSAAPDAAAAAAVEEEEDAAAAFFAAEAVRPFARDFPPAFDDVPAVPLSLRPRCEAAFGFLASFSVNHVVVGTKSGCWKRGQERSREVKRGQERSREVKRGQEREVKRERVCVYVCVCMCICCELAVKCNILVVRGFLDCLITG